MFYGWTDLPSGVGQLGVFVCVFIIIYFISGSKPDLKNTKMWKKISHFFVEKFWENILTYFKKFQQKFLNLGKKPSWFYKILGKVKNNNNNKKKYAKMENFDQLHA